MIATHIWCYSSAPDLKFYCRFHSSLLEDYPYAIGTNCACVITDFQNFILEITSWLLAWRDWSLRRVADCRSRSLSHWLRWILTIPGSPAMKMMALQKLQDGILLTFINDCVCIKNLILIGIAPNGKMSKF